MCVDCRPWPPAKEIDEPRSSGRFFYGIYLRQGEKTLQNYAVRVSPEFANASSYVRTMYGLHRLGKLVGNPSMDYSFVQLAAVRRRHKEAMPFLKEKGAALVLYLFPWSWRDLERRPSQALVYRLVDALDCEPDWWEVAA